MTAKEELQEETFKISPLKTTGARAYEAHFQANKRIKNEILPGCKFEVPEIRY